MARRASSAMARKSEKPVSKRQKLAHTLLIEILAHQFASPVRWIETQDVLFSGPDSVEKLVEVGPANILGNMARRTITSKYAAADRFASRDRKVLSFADHKEDIYSIYPEESTIPRGKSAPEERQPKTTPAKANTTEPAPIAASAAAVQKASASASTAAVDMPDVAVSPENVLRSLVANKLKKPFEDVRMETSIKDMSAGKSTLQNEILGDLGNEFGALPDSAEDKSLTELSALLAPNASGALGKQSSTLVAKCISSKMPAGFNMSAVGNYLKSRWGLGPGRQSGVLLIAITSEPASRLADDEAARGFFDSIVGRYAAHEGITLSTTSAESSSSASAAVAVDAATLNALQKDQTDYLTKQLKVLAKFLKIDVVESSSGDNPRSVESAERAGHALESGEHGEVYQAGIAPAFDAYKVRQYDSWWAWAKQDALGFFQDLESGSLPEEDLSLTYRIDAISNRSYPELLDLIEHLKATISIPNTNSYALRTAQRLLEACQYMLRKDPKFTYKRLSDGPKTTIEASGVIRYSEALREGPTGPTSYVDRLRKGIKPPNSTKSFPLVHLRSREGADWRYDPAGTDTFLDSLSSASSEGFSFNGKTALVTGAGKGSIGQQIVKGLLQGGANVIVTTSRQPSTVARDYQAIYTECGAKGSSLTVVPFNQGSVQDCEALIKYIYDERTGLGQDLDIFLPFAAISENGRELDRIDDKSELAHRMMLINTLRLLGYIKTQKEQRGSTSRPTQVILPLSPNHGTFGGDGLYSESKLGLETIFNRWSSESWGGYLTVCGAVIGWTRGTGLMNSNDVVAEAVEKYNVMTFSPLEMAFNILGLMAPAVNLMCQDEPVFADLNGGLHFISDLKKILNEARNGIMETSDIRKALHKENQLDQDLLLGPASSHTAVQARDYRPRANLRFDFPTLPDYDNTLEQLSSLKGMVDLSRVVVVVGYSELGPWGNARTRWEMEAFGEFSREGYLEMAWIMGLIRHFDGQIPGKKEHYIGWVDAKTGEAVHDDEIGPKYKARILEHSGVRLIEPELFKGYDPTRKELLQEVAIEEDLEPFEASKATAEAFALRHGDKAVITPIDGSSEYRIALKKGATLLIPKAVSFNRLVAGQIPSGWDPKKYGIADDIVSSVDPVTLYALCCVAEALLSAGITDPYEIYQHLHLSEVGICIGSGLGGAQSLRGMYRERWMDLPVQKNVLQEVFVNTTGAWVNMLLLGSTGPIKSPVGACATAIEALDIGAADIISGKVKMCLVGGTDNLDEESSQEFANMQATSNSVDEFKHGREPGEMSRPATTTRSGFMESYGSGIQLIASAELALQMGLPIHGIIASTTIASDKIGRSVPAPGQGILTHAREIPSAYPSAMLDISYRRKQMELAQLEIGRRRDSQLRMLFQEPTFGKVPAAQEREHFKHCADTIEQAAKRALRDAQFTFGNNFAEGDPAIAPIRAALAVWNLTIDDIDFASMHGTSTLANDKNEADIIDKQMKHLGRRKGNPVIGIYQKSLTGHPKGGAGAWMLNGALQALNTGIIPGNRNADNIDKDLRKFDTMVYPNKTLKKPMLKAFSVTSFGFGQKGAQVIGVHPRYALATLEREVYEEYRERNVIRQKRTYTHYNKALMTNSIFQAKEHNPYSTADETKIFLDPTARASLDKESHFSVLPNLKPQSSASPATATTASTSPGVSVHETPFSHTPLTNASTPLVGPSRPLSRGAPETTAVTTSSIEMAQAQNLQTLLSDISISNQISHGNMSVGVDVEDVSSIPTSNDVFLQRNFTYAELAYAKGRPSPEASLAGRWSAKEAVFKSLGVQSKGAGAPLKDIEIVSAEKDGGRPSVRLHGAALAAATEAGITKVDVSFSHCDSSVVAVALAFR